MGKANSISGEQREERVFAAEVVVVDFPRERIARATTTSWQRPSEAASATLFLKPGNDATLSGSRSPPTEPAATRRHARRTVSLSDGTQITFVTAGQFAVVETA